MPTLSRTGGLAAAATLIGAGAALTLTPPGDPAAGQAVFASAGCGGCHVMAAGRGTGRVGPNLDTLMPTAEAVRAQVVSGGGGMPPFAGSLGAQQISDVAEFVAQGSRGWRPAAASPASGRASGAPAPSAPGEVAVTLREWRIGASRRLLTPGKVVFRVRNAGRLAHTLSILRIRRPAATLPVVNGRVREIGRLTAVRLPAGTTRRVGVTLAAGSYVLISNLSGDVARGMALRVNVGGPTAPRPPAGTAGAPTTGAPGTTAPSPPTPPDGRTLFRASCGGCHTLADAQTTGTIGPSLGGDDRSAERIGAQIRRGEPDGSMPSFTGRLSEAEIDLIAAYVARG